MAYTFKSNIYMIPMMAYGDRSSGAENAHAGNIIDNNLELGARAATFFTDSPASLVINEGTYASTYDSGAGTFDISLSSFEGIIDNIHVKSTTTKAWTDIPTDSTVYLFAALIETDYVTSSRAKGSWVPISDSVETASSGRLLLAKVVTSGSNSYIYSTVDSIPTKKTYSNILTGDVITDGSLDSTKVDDTIMTKESGTFSEFAMVSISASGVLTESDTLRVTPDGGVASVFTAGETLSTGEIVSMSTTTDNSVVKTLAGGVNPVGVVYSGVASGVSVIVVHNGIANVLLDAASAATRGHHAYPSSSTAGRAMCYSGIDVANSEAHIGHPLESKSAGSLVKCILQF